MVVDTTSVLYRNIDPGFRHVQCETSDYQYMGLIVIPSNVCYLVLC